MCNGAANGRILKVWPNVTEEEITFVDVTVMQTIDTVDHSRGHR